MEILFFIGSLLFLAGSIIYYLAGRETEEQKLLRKIQSKVLSYQLTEQDKADLNKL